MTPGPTAIAEETRLAMAAGLPHHRSQAFGADLGELLGHLRWLLETDGDALLITGSGTTGMESALHSLLWEGRHALVVTGGKFAERWQELAALTGASVRSVDVSWGDSARAEAVEAAASAGPVDVFVCVASETSTGALHPVAELVSALRRHHPEAVVVVDGITAVGCVDLSMRRDRIDVLVTGSQKAFGLPPGAAFVGVSQRAWEAMEPAPRRSLTHDLRRERKQTATGQTAWTPAIPLVVGGLEVLRRWRSVGKESLFAHTALQAEVIRAGTSALGLKPFPTGLLTPALTSLAVPDDVDGASLVRWIREHSGYTVSGGQDRLKGRILRIGHLGPVDLFEGLGVLLALEAALEAHGTPIVPSAALHAARKVAVPALQSSVPYLLSP